MKRLIICADGTWNLRDQTSSKDKEDTRHPTNVTKIARGIKSRSSAGIDQIVFYHDGLGTSGPLDKFSGGAFGSGIEENIRNLYRFVLYNYEPGDELYFFGFSRGAFTVRSLAGFMKLVGLIEKEDDYYVPDLFACYEANKGPGTSEWKQAHHNVRTAAPCPPIRFIGVWDTVGALGAPGLLGQFVNRGKYQFHDVALSDSIQNAYHALAIDEWRKPFAATLWSKPAGWSGKLEQRWFAGAHCNVGGGYPKAGLSNCALEWIAKEAELRGLEFDWPYLKHYRPFWGHVLRNEYDGKYRLLGRNLREIGSTKDAEETVDKSVYLRYCDPNNELGQKFKEPAPYRPTNLDSYFDRANIDPKVTLASLK